MDELTTCPSCGAEQPPETRFCTKCGADRSLAPGPPATPGTGHFRSVDAPRGQTIACTFCGDVNDGDLFCRACGRARPGAEGTRCERCGTIDDGSRFCRTCGAPGGRLIADGPAPPTRNRRWLPIALAVAALLIAAGVALAVALGAFSGSKSKVRTTEPTTQPPPTTEEQQPTTEPTTTTAAVKPLVALRTVPIAALHAVDPADHCFGPAPRSGGKHVTLRLGGTYKENVAGKPATAPIMICGKGGDPSYASGTYAFRRSALGKDTRLGKLTALYGIDESGGQEQADAQVKLNVAYYGKTVCESELAAWQAPGTLSCDLSKVDRPADTSQLKISQTVQGAKAPDVWAGLMSPRVVLMGHKG